MMTVNESVINCIMALLDGKSIPSSRFSKSLMAIIKDKGVLIPLCHGTRVSYKLAISEKSNLEDIIRNHYHINCNLEDLKHLQGDNDMSRSKLVNLTGNSKAKKRSTWPGFVINTYHDITIKIEGKESNMKFLKGTVPFIYSFGTFSIPNDVIVVGMENPENFLNIEYQKYLFDELFPKNKILFVSRYPQESVTSLREWLLSIPNKYYHFGDFDIAGIEIYLTQFKKYLGKRANFLIPNDIESRLKNGNSQLFHQQDKPFDCFENIEEPKLNNLLQLIMKYQKGYEQEGYIKE